MQYVRRVFDRDDNGYITRDELRAALEMIGEPVTDAQLNHVLALGDIDHDGRIDYEGATSTLLFIINHHQIFLFLGFFNSWSYVVRFKTNLRPDSKSHIVKGSSFF